MSGERYEIRDRKDGLKPHLLECELGFDSVLQASQAVLLGFLGAP